MRPTYLAGICSNFLKAVTHSVFLWNIHPVSTELLSHRLSATDSRSSLGLTCFTVDPPVMGNFPFSYCVLKSAHPTVIPGAVVIWVVCQSGPGEFSLFADDVVLFANDVVRKQGVCSRVTLCNKACLYRGPLHGGNFVLFQKCPFITAECSKVITTVINVYS